ncbi:MAG: dihydrolipoyl dehydrogenase [Marmoricola sp.]|nr:dihydrolipoyl dehydrogenase [Marmoricola sp.]
MVESKYWGGVCLNVGCIPSKALLKNAELAHTLTHEKDKYGIEGDATMSFGPTHARSRAVSDGIVKGVHFLMKKNKITEINGWGTFTGSLANGEKSIEVKAEDGSISTVTADKIIIATGAKVRLVPGVELSQNVVTYEEQILDSNLPSSIIIGGSGAIGVEFAYVLKNFGVDVTIVEFLDRIVPTEDAEVSKELLKHYKKLGINILTSTAVKSVEDTGSGVRVTVAPAAGGEEQVLEAGKFLAAFGFAPRLDGYGLEVTGVATTERGAIAVDERGRTNVPDVYAIGDVTGKLMLAHTAEAMGIVAAETIVGAETMEIDFDMIPRATYCQPQIASFGYTEAQAKEKGYDVKVAKFPFSANGKAMGLGEPVGFVKVVADAKYGEILGVHIIGPGATEIIAECVTAMELEATVEAMMFTIHAHPTLAESLLDGFSSVEGMAVNV